MAKSELGGVIINPLADLVKLQIEQNELVKQLISAEANKADAAIAAVIRLGFDNDRVTKAVYGHTCTIEILRKEFNARQDILHKLYEIVSA